MYANVYAVSKGQIMPRPVKTEEPTGPLPELGLAARRVTGEMNGREVANKTGGAISHDTVRRLWNGEKIGVDKLDIISRAFKRNPNELRQVGGYPPLAEWSSQNFAVAAMAPMNIEPPGRNVIDSLPQQLRRPILELLESLNASESVSVPILGRVSAGVGIFAEENIVGYVKVSPDVLRENDYRLTFALRVEGESMQGAHILHGDTVIFNQSNVSDAHDNDIVAAVHNGGLIIKRLRKFGNDAHLESDWADGRRERIEFEEEDLVIGVFASLRRDRR